MQRAIKILLLFVDGLFNGVLVEKYGQLENRDWTLEWTGLDSGLDIDRTGLFLGGSFFFVFFFGGGGWERLYYFF